MKTLILIIVIVLISYATYYFIREAVLERKAQQENAMNLVDFTELPADYVDESIPASSKPAFDPLAQSDADSKYERPAANLRRERDFLENPVDEKNRDDSGNPYAV